MFFGNLHFLVSAVVHLWLAGIAIRIAITITKMQGSKRIFVIIAIILGGFLLLVLASVLITILILYFK